MRLTPLLSCVVLVFLCGCRAGTGAAKAAGPTNVLVVINAKSPASMEVGKYYAAKRGIAAKFICKIDCPTDEKVDDKVFRESIRNPIRNYLTRNGLEEKIDYIVLTKGIPIRTADRWGTDSALTCLFQDNEDQMNNPYFGAEDHFSHSEYTMYLVTRLDGLTVADAKALVDRSLAAKPEEGPFLLDLDTKFDRQEGYKFVNDYMRGAAASLKKKGFSVELYDGPGFAVRTGLMGYYSWGVHDAGYNIAELKKLTFIPGSIAEMAYSASAITLDGTHYWKKDESNIADLVAQGVTGVRGFVQEPLTPALADSQILFDRYTSGFNLAESFYAASRFVHWRDVVLGDPLCAPYAKKK